MVSVDSESTKRGLLELLLASSPEPQLSTNNHHGSMTGQGKTERRSQVPSVASFLSTGEPNLSSFG